MPCRNTNDNEKQDWFIIYRIMDCDFTKGKMFFNMKFATERIKKPEANSQRRKVAFTAGKSKSTIPNSIDGVNN